MKGTPFQGQITGISPPGWFHKESHTLVSADAQTNVIVSAEPLDPDIDSKAYAAAEFDLLTRDFEGFVSIEMTSVMVFGGRAGIRHTFTWTPPDGRRVYQTQFHWAAGGRGYTATATSNDEVDPLAASVLNALVVVGGR